MILSPISLDPINLISRDIVTQTCLLPEALCTAVPEPASIIPERNPPSVSYTHLRAHET